MKLHVDRLQILMIVKALEEYQKNHYPDRDSEKGDEQGAAGTYEALKLSRALLEWAEARYKCDIAKSEYKEAVHGADKESVFHF